MTGRERKLVRRRESWTRFLASVFRDAGSSKIV